MPTLKKIQMGNIIHNIIQMEQCPLFTLTMILNPICKKNILASVTNSLILGTRTRKSGSIFME